MDPVKMRNPFNYRPFHPADWLRYGGVLLWVLVAVPLLISPGLAEEPPRLLDVIGWWSAALLFLLAFWLQVRRLPARDAIWKRVVYLVTMSLAAVAVSFFSEGAAVAFLGIIIASLLPWLLPVQAGVAWVIALGVIITGMLATQPEVTWTIAMMLGGLFSGLALFAFMASFTGMRQLEARNALRRVNSELRATQALLAENTRIAERVRIARDLHDLVGHHLTALSLNLEVATHLTEGKAREHVDQARSIARLLLSDVREVVSNMRTDDRVDLAEAIRELAGGMPEPEIHLDLPPDLALTDPSRAQILLRCAQELITNTVRHADARNLWISLRTGDEGLELVARDDGRGAADPDPGNGLRGMRERLNELGGDLEVTTRPNEGFRVDARVPKEAEST